MSLPRVSVVVMAWSPAQRPYLDLCVRSIDNLEYPKELLDVVIVAPPSYAKQLLYDQIYIRVREPGLGEQFFASQGYNFGYAQTDPSSKYILTLNDDVCLTRRSLLHLVDVAENLSQPLSMINATSPCDTGCAHLLTYGVTKGETRYRFDKQNYRIENVEHIIPEMLNAESEYPWGVIISPFLCMYATLISRAALAATGGVGFDPRFEGGPDDIDWSFRLLAAGGLLFTALHALIWHFGSVTIETSYPAARWIRNTDYFRSKWGRFPAFVDQAKYDRMALAAQGAHGEG